MSKPSLYTPYPKPSFRNWYSAKAGPLDPRAFSRPARSSPLAPAIPHSCSTTSFEGLGARRPSLTKPSEEVITDMQRSPLSSGCLRRMFRAFSGMGGKPNTSKASMPISSCLENSGPFRRSLISVCRGGAAPMSRPTLKDFSTLCFSAHSVTFFDGSPGSAASMAILSGMSTGKYQPPSIPPLADMSIHEPILIGLMRAPTSFRRSISLSGAPTFQKKSTIFWMKMFWGPEVLHVSFCMLADVEMWYSISMPGWRSSLEGMLSDQICQNSNTLLSSSWRKGMQFFACAILFSIVSSPSTVGVKESSFGAAVSSAAGAAGLSSAAAVAAGAAAGSGVAAAGAAAAGVSEAGGLAILSMACEILSTHCFIVSSDSANIWNVRLGVETEK
mmetsp:Transcript_16242/g.63332  ORF Transcript_16242/g.63332 Transcript_16242/m.63332 type:complete len:387 (+) Transcript_16242:248-1408(+)